MTEDPQTPPDDETPEAAAGGDAVEPEQSADPSDAPEATADQPAPEEPAAADEPAAAEEPAAEEPAAGEVPAPVAEEPAADEVPAPVAETPADEPAAEEPTSAEQPDAGEPLAAHPAAAGPSADADPAAEPDASAEAPAAEGEAAPAGDERPRPAAKRRKDKDDDDKPDVVPGAHLEPDLVLERESGSEQDEYGQYAEVYGGDDDSDATTAAGETTAEAPAPRKVLDLAADARYAATGKRKTAVARVILKPGTGVYLINGRPLENFFPRPGLQVQARQPLETAGYEARMDVVAKIHGGGVSSQAGALRHGIARALTEADPALRTELKRKGYLTRDARVKERKKAGLKKARKRPQFSKR